jgi:NTE family protein
MARTASPVVEPARQNIETKPVRQTGEGRSPRPNGEGQQPARQSSDVKIVNLALQGGGSHGAFTWGVMDKLLEDGRLRIDGLSATSAGAMNAGVYAYHHMIGGTDGARQGLHDFWQRISKEGDKTRNPMDAVFESMNLGMLSSAAMFETMTRMLSPYEFNPMNLNPLKDVLKASIDFDKLHHCVDTKLRICATNVRSGKIKIFANGEITPEVLLASACLPSLFQAVEIDGEHYWDGGYMGNPAIYPMFVGMESSDVILVHINPIIRPSLPKTSPEIMNRLNEISFNSTLMREMRAVKFIKDIMDGDWIKDEHKHKLRYIFMHSIRNDEAMASLTPASKSNTKWSFLTGLRDNGRKTAEHWLAEHFDHLGKRTTIDVEKEFF